MATAKITALPLSALPLDGTELLELAKNGVSVKAPSSAVAAAYATDPANVLPAANGGTGIASYTVGNMLYAATTTSLAKVRPSPVRGAALLAGADAAFTGSIAGTTLTVASGVAGIVVPDMVVAGASVAPNTVILEQLTGTAGKDGTYTVSVSQTVGSEAMIGATVTAQPTYGVLTAPVGGTGFTSYTVGNMLYADTATSLAKVKPSPVAGAALIAGATATFTGSIASTTLTIAPGVVGNVVPNMVVAGAGVTAGTVILEQLTGTAGKDGTYSIDISQTVGSVAMTGTVPTNTPAWGVVSVAGGGTGVSTLTGYVKAAGTAPMTASATIPAADISGELAVAQGGTGVSTLTGYVKGNGTADMTASPTIPYADLAGRAYLQAYSTADQTGSVSAATAIQFPTTDSGFSQGISMAVDGSGNLTRIKFAVAGLYEIAPSIQFANSAASDYDVTIWLRQNGSNLANSSTVLTVPKIGDGGAGFFQLVILVKTTVVDEYVEIMWLPENAAVTVEHIAAGAIAPAAPSAIIYAERIA